MLSTHTTALGDTDGISTQLQFLAATNAFTATILLVFGTSCEPRPPQQIPLPSESWEIAPMVASGSTEFDLSPEVGIIAVGAGAPMNGIRITEEAAAELPIVDYRISLEAQRAAGDDFFLGLTFPAGRPDTYLSLILGGWGGATIGLSNIDHYDASQNATTTSRKFRTGQWYTVLVEVRSDRIHAEIDGLTIIDTSTRGRHLSLKPGPIESCRPLGIATWRTEGRFRNIVIERLP